MEGSWRGSGTGIQRRGMLLFGAGGIGRRKGGLDCGSEKNLIIRVGEEIRLTLS